jgi:hypothetical protein
MIKKSFSYLIVLPLILLLLLANLSYGADGYVTSMSETITYNYATEADVKVYAVSLNGDKQFLGYKTEAGYAFNFTVNKSRSDLLGQKLTPNYFTDKIISIRNKVFDIVRYTDEGVASISPLVIKYKK